MPADPRPGATPARITVAIDDLGIGGSQKAVLQLVESLSGDYAFQVIGLGRDNAFAGRLAAAGAEVRVLGVGRWDPRVRRALLRAIAAHRSCLIVAALYKSSFAVPRVAAAAGLPFVLADRSRTYDARIRDLFFPVRLLSRLYFRDYLDNVARAALLVVQSREDSAAYEQLLPGHRDRIVAIPNGVDLARYGLAPAARWEARREFRQRWGVGEDSFVVGSVMGLRADKRPALLAEIASGLGAGEALVVVGQGPEARRIAGSPGLIMAGPLPPEMVPRALAAFDLFVLPSLADPFPNVLLEAMAASLPVVASAQGGALEIVAQGETGSLVDSEDTAAVWREVVRAYARDRARLTAHGVAARVRARDEFGLERFASRWRSALATALFLTVNGRDPGNRVPPGNP